MVVVYSRPANLLVVVFSFLVYYILFFSIITYSNLGVFFITIPVTYVILLVLTASVLVSLSVAHARLAWGSRKARYAGATSPVSVVAGSLVASCTCVAPFVAQVLYLIGFDALEVSGFLTLLQRAQVELFSAFIGLNIFAIIVLLLALSRDLRQAPDHRGA